MVHRTCRVCGRVLIEKGISQSGIVYLFCPKCKRMETSQNEEEMANDFGWSNRRDVGSKIRRRQKQLRPFVEKLNDWFTRIEHHDPYAVLGVSCQDSAEKVRSRFKQLVHRYHPDRSGGNEEKMREVNKAYEDIKSRLGNKGR